MTMSAALKCAQISGSHSSPGATSLSVHDSIRSRWRNVANWALNSCRRFISFREYEMNTLSIAWSVEHNPGAWEMQLERALAQTARREDRLTGQPSRILRCQKNRDRRDVVRLGGAAQRSPRLGILLKIAADDSHRVRSLGLHQPGIDRVHAHFLRPQFFGQHPRDRIHGSFRSRIDRRLRRCDLAHGRADIDDGSAVVAEELH